MPDKDIIVVGASAGGFQAIRALCQGLPADLPAAVFVVLHLSAGKRSLLGKLLARTSSLEVITPDEGDPIVPGRVYIARPDHHLLVRDGKVLVRRGPHENHVRPSIDALFRSAALAYGGRVIGVVLTGLLDDGTQGLVAIKARGGTSVIQDPADAAWPAMPRNALRGDHVDHCLPLASLPELLVELTHQPANPDLPAPFWMKRETDIAEQELESAGAETTPPGVPSAITCPRCSGVLNEIEGETGPKRFRCQIGHAFSPETLVADKNAEVERAFGVAVKTLRERRELFSTLRREAEQNRRKFSALRWAQAERDAEKMLATLADALVKLAGPINTPDVPEAD